MKRIVIFVVALACGFGVQAQNHKDLERVKHLRDSVTSVLDRHRENYAANKDLRKELTPIIQSLEQRIAQLQEEYDKLLESISALEAQGVIAAYDESVKAAEAAKAAKAKKQQAEQGVSTDKVVDDGKEKRDLIANGFFISRLSPNDYQTLRNLQKREVELKTLIDSYFAEYAKLLALQEQYMKAENKKQAAGVATQFTAQNGKLDRLNGQIASAWLQVYDNKVYIYDLLMEREGNNAMISFSTEAVNNASREIDDRKGKYHSEALMNYFVRKKMMTEYELRIASNQLLTSACDSLNTVMSELKNREYFLAKLSLPRRNFIRYENIVVKTTPIYTANNPVPQTTVEDYGTVYRLRIGSSTRKMSVAQLRGVAPVSYSYIDEEYVYFAGGFRTEQEAQKGVAQLKKLGFREPIISVWVDGEYYSTLEEMRRSENQYNIEITGIATLPEEIKKAIFAHKEDCIISRVGPAFVVGTFVGKGAAEAVATAVQKINADVEVKIVKQQ